MQQLYRLRNLGVVFDCLDVSFQNKSYIDASTISITAP